MTSKQVGNLSISSRRDEGRLVPAAAAGATALGNFPVPADFMLEEQGWGRRAVPSGYCPVKTLLGQ